VEHLQHTPFLTLDRLVRCFGSHPTSHSLSPRLGGFVDRRWHTYVRVEKISSPIRLHQSMLQGLTQAHRVQVPPCTGKIGVWRFSGSEWEDHLLLKTTSGGRHTPAGPVFLTFYLALYWLLHTIFILYYWASHYNRLSILHSPNSNSYIQFSLHTNMWIPHVISRLAS
jgi:hypothetical protein